MKWIFGFVALGILVLAPEIAIPVGTIVGLVYAVKS